MINYTIWVCFTTIIIDDKCIDWPRRGYRLCTKLRFISVCMHSINSIQQAGSGSQIYVLNIPINIYPPPINSTPFALTQQPPVNRLMKDRKNRLEESILISKLVVAGIGLYALFQSIIYTVGIIVIPCQRAKTVLSAPATSEYLLILLTIITYAVLHFRRVFLLHMISCILFIAVKLAVAIYIAIVGHKALGECYLTQRLKLFIYLVAVAESGLAVGMIFLIRRVRRKNLQISRKSLTAVKRYPDEL